MSAIRVELELENGQFVTRMLYAGQSLEKFNQEVIKSSPALRKQYEAAANAAGGFDKLSLQANTAFRSMQRVNDTSKSFLGTMRDLTIVAGGVSLAIAKISQAARGVAGDVIRVNSSFERMQFLMQSMSTAVDPVKDATATFKELRDFSLVVPFNLQTISDSFVKMKSTGIDPMAGALQSFADGVAAAGGTDETLKRATLAITQMSGKGVIQMEELRQQLGEAMPRATELMARSMGVSYAELVDAISTGRVRAQPALQALQAELDRTFGGASQRMMRTFSGQASQTSTLMQTLANTLGNAGFFQAVKDQLTDFNRLLASDSAQQLATSIGQALTTAIEWLRKGIDWVVYYGEEIMRVGAIIGTAFVFSRAISGFQALGQQMSRSRNEMRLLMGNWVALKASMNAGTAAGAVAGMTGFARALGVARVGLLGFRAAFAIAMPWLTLGASVIAGLVGYFGGLSKASGDAQKEMEEFGNVTRKNLDIVTKAYQQEQRELEELIKKREYYAQYQMGFNKDMKAANAQRFRDEFNAKNNIPALEEKVAQNAKKQAEWETEIRKRELDKRIEDELNHLDDRMAALKQAYDREAKASGELYAKESQLAIQNNQSTADAKKAYDQRRMAEVRNLYDQELSVLSDYYASVQEMAESNNAEQRTLGERLSAILTSRIVDVQEKLANADQLKLQIEMNADDDSDKSLIKAQNNLEKLKDQYVELEADLEGVSSAVARVNQEFNRGDYGDLGRAEVRALYDETIATTQAIEEMKELIEGRKQLEGDVASEIRRKEEELMEIRGKGLSSAEKIIQRIEDGAYKGIGPGQSPMQRQLSGIAQELSKSSDFAESLGRNLREGAFGNASMQAANGFLDTLQRMNSAWSAFRNNVESTGLNSTLNKMGGIFGSILSPGAGIVGSGVTVAGGFFNKLIGQESSGNKYAAPETSSARGIGQFIESTWLQFLGEMHPEMLNQGRKAALDMRYNNDLMTQAIKWYASKNAAGLQGAGLPANDANLYLSHFLGPQGALKVLTSDINTLVRDVLPDAARANPFMRNFTTGDLQNWAIKKFGTGFSGVNELSGQQVQNPGTTNNATLQSWGVAPAIIEDLEKLKQLTLDLDNAKLNDYTGDIAEKIRQASDATVEYGKRVSATRDLIKSGEFGAERDPDAARYQELIALAKKWDDAEEEAAKRAKLRRQTEGIDDRVQQKRDEIAKRQNSASFEIANPGLQGPSSGYRQLEQEFDDYLRKAEAAYGRDSEMYAQLQQQKVASLAQYRNMEVSEEAAKWAQKNAISSNGLMNDQQQKAAAINAEIARIQQEVAAFSGSAEERVRIEAAAQARIKALRAEAATAMAGPMQNMMNSWANVGANMEQAATGWLDSGIDAIATFVTTGKANFKQLFQQIAKDMIKILLRGALSNMFKRGGSMKSGQMPGGAAGKKGASASMGAKGGGMGKMPFGIAHTGGIIGSSNLIKKAVNPAVFAGAKKFHTGGMIKGMGLGPDEVPIIAKKGEGVFTPEQMKAMGNSGGMGGGLAQNIAVTSNVTVNASGGTPTQNQDLAKRVQKEVEGSMRGLVADELRKQMRPNNMLSR
jgi:tape measure domain-containing protein